MAENYPLPPDNGGIKLPIIGAGGNPKAGCLLHQPSGREFFPAVVCETFRQRLGGMLMPYRTSALYGIPDFWVHTFGMKMSIDAVFCDSKGRVLKVMTLPPNRFSPPVWGTKIVWETREGGLAPFVHEGDYLTCG